MVSEFPVQLNTTTTVWYERSKIIMTKCGEWGDGMVAMAEGETGAKRWFGLVRFGLDSEVKRFLRYVRGRKKARWGKSG